MADDGFGLACKTCGHIFPTDVTMGVVGADNETEHGAGPDDDIALELVVLCPRCRKAMQLDRTEPIAAGERHHYSCTPCHRTRTVTQRSDRG